jgi:hypothetical protein
MNMGTFILVWTSQAESITRRHNLSILFSILKIIDSAILKLVVFTWQCRFLAFLANRSIWQSELAFLNERYCQEVLPFTLRVDVHIPHHHCHFCVPLTSWL